MSDSIKQFIIVCSFIILSLQIVSCGKKENESSANQKIVSDDASEEIKKLDNFKKYTKELFESYVQTDGIHSYGKDEWLNNTPFNDELSEAKFKDKEVVFIGKWTKINNNLSSNEYWTDAGMRWDYVHVNPNCWSNPNVPNVIEIKIASLSDFQEEELSKKLAGKEVAITGKINNIIAKGGTNACEDATLRIWINGLSAKVYDLATKKKVY